MIESVSAGLSIFSILRSLFHTVFATRALGQYFRTRHLRQVWGIKNGDQVIVVCSELDDPDDRQQVEEREYIYSYKYGDLDAYIEVLVTLLRLYPAIKMQVMSAGEAGTTQLDLVHQFINTNTYYCWSLEG